MKKPRNGDSIINAKSRSNDNKSRKSLYELSLSLIFSLWCLVFLFYSRLGLTLGNGGHSQADNRTIPYGEYSYVSNGSNDHSNGMHIDSNISANKDFALQDHESVNFNCSLQQTNRLEVVLNVLSYANLICEIKTEEEQKRNKPETLQTGRNSGQTYLNLDELRNTTRQEKDSGALSHLMNITQRLEPDGTKYNYASASKGAKVLAHNKEAKGASNILGKDHDKYLRNPCSVEGKFVEIELAEETLVDAVKIGNFEHYSSNFKDFELFGSLTYPTENWFSLGKFTAANVKHAKCFKLNEPKWVRYLKLYLLSHYGSEFYCTLSVLEVYGIDAIERMLEDLMVTNSTATPSLKPEPGPGENKRNDEGQSQNDAKGLQKNDDGQKTITDVMKDSVLTSQIPDPVVELRQKPNGRIPGDTVLKILMQKVRSLEINFSTLEDYIKEVNHRQGQVFPELEQELLGISMVLEKSKNEIKDLIGWKETMDKEFTDLESWKADMSSHVDSLVRENSILRIDVEKVLRDQASLENKEVVVVAMSFSFLFVAIFKLISERLFMFFATSQSDEVFPTSRGWVLILISSSITILITLLYS